MSEAWKIVGDVWRGALSLRNEGANYLLQFPREPKDAYDERKKWRSVFFDQLKRTIKGFAGMVFAENPAPTDAPKPILDLFNDIDLCGNDFNTFLLNSFEKYLRDGNGFFLATSPPLSEKNKSRLENGRQLTAADRKNDRAYGVFFTASQCINHRFENINGREVLTQITIEEKTIEKKGEFGETCVIRHRIFRRGSFEVRRFADEAKLQANDFTTEDSGTTSFEDIPIVPITEIGSEPPFLGIALLNILHYNKSSDFDDHCHKINNPQYVFYYDSIEDAQKSKEITLGNNNALVFWGERARAEILEVAGNGAEVTTNRIKDIESQMARLGLEKLAPMSDGQAKTATEIDSDNIQSQSELAMLTRKFENAVEQFIYFLGVQANSIVPNSVNLAELEKGKVKLNIAYDKLTLSIAEMEYVRNAVKDKLLSNETYLEILPTMLRTLPEEWTKEIELERLRKERDFADR